MVKMRSVFVHEVDKTPEHIVQEVHELTEQMGKAIMHLVSQHNANITMSAFANLHAFILKTLIVDETEEIQRALAASVKSMVVTLEKLDGKSWDFPPGFKE